ncbi:HAD-IIIC family phosphatase [Marinomonas sp. 2405UD68-3]|uniref:HAD-IIIC family phosphatase n=1 Tax=Marinomonas sp. 2405UD68-3 TaxID=3391835 RepID=UPI0039C99593
MTIPHLSFSGMLKQLGKHEAGQMKPLNITILRNIVLEPIEVPIKYFSQKSNYEAQLTFGELDNIFQDSLDVKKIQENTDVVLIVSPLHALSEKILNSFSSLSQEQREKELNYIKDLVLGTLRNIRQLNVNCTIFWLSFELPVNPAYGINDHNMPNGHTQFIKKINLQISNIISQFNGCILLNSDSLLRQIGVENFYDWRYWYINRCLYSKDTLISVARLMLGYIDSLQGGTKKCLVLDCDNTLWGGVVGEDGLAGIKLSTHYPGSCYRDFQSAIVDLHHQGVIIALCSKNNETDVMDVLSNHPYMLLKKEHISIYQINWHDKASNLTRIAEQLNISVDSLVFIDDSEFEIALVNKQLPQVRTILLDKKKPAEYNSMLRELTCFDKISITSEDINRGKRYKEQSERISYAKETNNIDDYLRTLEMHLKVSLATKNNISRVAQLTQKTNQFNLTTKRYSEDDIKTRIDSNKYDVVLLEVSDRFGYMGEVGVVIVSYHENLAIIDTFLLSCRILGRTVEKAFLSNVLQTLKLKGILVVNASYLPTSKNSQVAYFYNELGFNVKSESNTETTYELILNYICENNNDTYFIIESLWQTTIK